MIRIHKTVFRGILSAMAALLLAQVPAMADGPPLPSDSGTGRAGYSHPSPEEIPEPSGPQYGAPLEFNAGALIENCSEAAFSLSDIAVQELFADDSKEIPAGSDCVKYNDWFYGYRISNSFEDGEYREQHDWNAAFVSWCADQLGYIGLGRFPRTADGGEMLWRLCEYGYDHIQSNSIYHAGSFDPVRVSDLIFIPREGCGCSVGIVTEAKPGFIRFIAGDTDSQVMELTMLYEEYQPDVSFVRVKTIEDYGLYYLTEFLKNELSLNTAAVSGIVANLWYESSFDPSRVGDGGTSFGICQWHDERWEYLIDFCNAYGYDARSAEGQLQFMKYELETEYGELLDRLRSCSDTKEEAYYNAFYFCADFENPAEIEKKANDRGNFACNSVYEKIRNNA